MSQKRPRITREKQTIGTMLSMYCSAKHHVNGLCPGCTELEEYAFERLDKCPFQEGKTTCAKCPVHCYRPSMREKVKAVMRYSGPRMVYRHPAMTIFHLIDGRRNKPVKPPA
jgi:aldehyde:ferredoxin oxidoreductase